MKIYSLVSATALLLAAACSEVSTGPTLEDTVAELPEDTKQDMRDAAAQREANPLKPAKIEAVAVRIGLDGPNLDACGGYGEVTGLNPQGDNFLSVRIAPDVEAEELDRLPQGAGVSMCDHANGWIGIVYQAQGIDDPNCETGSPVPAVAEYSGPCRSGWVSERFIELIAG